ncbi:unnamed protein product [Effrenium voratum]|uniref:Pentatricopeptide repeat-containing protein n=1 Tax=Effrenium voratum TaxID=2562239 RepID=A0AA36N1W3_9DINO|nr:unnamed protein product [Effrenium voratum]
MERVSDFKWWNTDSNHAKERWHYARLITNLGKRGQLQSVLTAVAEMEQRGVELDSSCYSALVEACISCRSVDHAFKIFKDMQKRGIDLTEDSCYELISACGFGDQWRRCVEVLRFLQRKVRACVRCKQFPLVLQLLLQMEAHSQPHYQTAQELRLELAESLPGGWKTWESCRAHDYAFRTWEQPVKP